MNKKQAFSQLSRRFAYAIALNTWDVLTFAYKQLREIAQIARETAEVAYLIVKNDRTNMSVWQKTIFIHYMGAYAYIALPVQKTPAKVKEDRFDKNAYGIAMAEATGIPIHTDEAGNHFATIRDGKFV